MDLSPFQFYVRNVRLVVMSGAEEQDDNDVDLIAEVCQLLLLLIRFLLCCYFCRVVEENRKARFFADSRPKLCVL